MTALIRTLIVTLAAAVGADDAPRPPASREISVAGCYAVTLTPWTPRLSLGSDDIFVTPPSIVELTATPGTDGFQRHGFVVRGLAGNRSLFAGSSYWQLHEGRVRVVFTTGHAGLSMFLHQSGSDLVGTAETFWDFPRQEQTSRVTASRVPCSAPQAKR